MSTLEMHEISICVFGHHGLNFLATTLADGQLHVTTRHRANERDAFTLPLSLGQ
jgi:hypothetical protein